MTRLLTVLSLLFLPLAAARQAAAFYPPDGSKPAGPGAVMIPNDGMCVIGVAANGNMLVDWSITNYRDCVAWTKAADSTVDLVGLDTQTKCTDADASGSDGYKHNWSTSLCYDTVNLQGISRIDLDNTDAMCISKGGTVVTTGKCVAYGWVYRNRKSDGSLAVTGSGITTTKGDSLSDGLGFCYTSMRMTGTNADGGIYTSAATCPSLHNSAATAPVGEWLPCLSSATGCQTQASYDLGLGWSFSSSQCVYTYGVKGRVNSLITNAIGSTVAIGTLVDISTITTQGDCLAAGYLWDAWLPSGPGQAVLEDNSGAYTGLPNIPSSFKLYNLNALSAVEDGGGAFYSGTGAVCLKCHSDQSRAYQERNKPGYVKTRHRNAVFAVGKPFQKFFTATNSDWGLDGVECSMCHSTAKPPQDDLIQVNPAGTANEGLPKSASGHNQTEYGTHLVDICYTCHGTAASPVTVNPASVIPVSGGKFALTGKGLEPIANEFLNSPHAQYKGSSTKVDVGNKKFYQSTFEGYVCRSAAGKLSSTTYPNSGACTGAGYTWYTTTNNGSFCYYSLSSCTALPQAQWNTTFDTASYPWAADTGGPGGVCAGVGIGSIITTVYRDGEAEKIPNVDSALNPACTNTGDGGPLSGASGFWVKDGEPTGASIVSGQPLDTAQGNCMTCHDVHWAIADTNPEAEPFRRECAGCHMNPGSVSDAPQIDLTTINHLAGTGTPLENATVNPSLACETCHMPRSNGEGSSRMHLWRINPDVNYTTMGASAVTLDADGQGWVDVDHACGQCHGGGTVQDAQHMPAPHALYRTKAQLAAVAQGMHDAAISYPVTFTTKVTGLTVDVVAYVNCGVGIVCPTFTYGWDWGDGAPDGSGNPASHLYASYGSKKITLIVKRLGGKVVGTVSRNVTTVGTDVPPVASATCTWDKNTWTATVHDTSTDSDPTPVQTTTVDWDDASGRSVGGASATLVHTYLDPGTYDLTFTAIDSALKSASIPLSCTNGPVAPADFQISGTVLQSDASTPVPNANVVVKLGRVRVLRVQTDVDGDFAVGTLRPGTYKIKIRKTGFTFAVPAATKTVGPDSTGNIILAVAP